MFDWERKVSISSYLRGKKQQIKEDLRNVGGRYWSILCVCVAKWAAVQDLIEK